MTEIRRPKQAATVILLRRAEAKGFEVFLTRRPDGMPSLGGMYCYPGGTVTKDDFNPPMIVRCRGVTPKQARKILGAHYSPSEAMGLWVAGVREVFEEVGVLLATEQSGAQLIMDDNRAARLAQKHAALLAKSMSFLELLESESLVCNLAALGPLFLLANAVAGSTALRHPFFHRAASRRPDSASDFVRSHS